MKRAIYLVPALGFMAGIYWMSSYPAPEALHYVPILAGMKVVHLVEYGLLTFLWVWGLSRATPWTWPKIATISLLITVFWGIIDEIHQSFVPQRTGRVVDAFTDLLAAVLLIGTMTFIRGRTGKLCYKAEVDKNKDRL